MARAAINILGASGETYDLASNGVREIGSSRTAKGVYRVTGCLGMVPFPPIDDGWGYTLNQVDGRADIDTEFVNDVLTVTATKDGQPYDLKHMITLHILVPDLPPIKTPEAESPTTAEG
ncbi:phage tail protein [Pseudomonas sp. TNT2022 ID681]|uniref:Phage tail protein n=1 Tax=Pseudomonas fontis TaxID=2942633 RepID=A0ABT5NRF9_9PSED|nr:phage tail protein [Pseudomonas fontis]MDD0990755.1 phage tail protein [Pseudomonas fontis]